MKRSCLELLADVASSSTLITQKLVYAIWGLCWYNSKRGGGRRTTLADWTWHQGASAGCRGRGAIAGCYRGGAIVVCYGWGGGLGEWTWCRCWVPLQGARGEGHDQLWGSGRGAIVGCQGGG